MGHIRSRIQVNSQFALVLRLLVVLGDPLAHFRRRETNDRVLIGVVVRLAVKDIDAQQAFFQLVFVAVQRLLDNKTQQRRIAFAVPEQRTCQHALQLLPDGFSLVFAGRMPLSLRLV